VCGIAGVAGSMPNREVLDAMGAALVHRGPDSAGMMLDPDAGFAFRRLSIIDVAGGDQPIFNEDESAAIVLNGEIYNYRELRESLVRRGHRFRTRSDVETVLHLWEEKGEACLSDLRGMFAFAIWNRRDHSLFLARDRVGKKPLYHCSLQGGGIAFASEIKSLLQHPEVRREPNLDAIDQYLVLQYVPTPMTAFRGIQRIPPAHWLRWRNGRFEIRRYWRLEYEDKLRGSESALKEELLGLLRDAVKIRLESEVPLGAFLSGGIDSSAVVALAAEALGRPLKTFSIGFKAAQFDESRYAREVAGRFATDHTELILDSADPQLVDEIVWHYDQPFGDSSAIPSFQVARITRPYVTVVLNGDGGDESFAGYDRYQLSRYGAYFKIPSSFRRGLQSAVRPFSRYVGRGGRLLRSPIRKAGDAYFATLIHLSLEDRSTLYEDEFASHLSKGIPPPLADLRKVHHPALLDCLLDTDVENYLPDDLLVKMDIATMANSLEARSPFLDHKVMEFAARLPADMKLRHGESKYLLKSALQGLLPSNILRRRKMGFGVPLGAWLRTDFKELLLDTVLSERAASRGYFKLSAVRRMVDAHLAGSNRYQYVLWDLLLLERWHRMFIDATPSPRSSIVASTSSSV